MRQEKHMSTILTMTTTMTASGTSNGVYISSPIQHNNILRSHQICFKANNAHHDHDFLGLYESLKTLSNSPLPMNCIV
jgi:hypothetical protein